MPPVMQVPGQLVTPVPTVVLVPSACTVCAQAGAAVSKQPPSSSANDSFGGRCCWALFWGKELSLTMIYRGFYGLQG
jgi:hypothetical protein